MTLPDDDGLEALARRHARGEATDEELLAVLDPDRWLASCDVLDLDPNDVEAIVRHAIISRVARRMRSVVYAEMRNGTAVHGTDRDSADILLASTSETGHAEAKAVASLCASLRRMSEDL